MRRSQLLSTLLSIFPSVPFWTTSVCVNRLSRVSFRSLVVCVDRLKRDSPRRLAGRIQHHLSTLDMARRIAAAVVVMVSGLRTVDRALGDLFKDAVARRIAVAVLMMTFGRVLRVAIEGLGDVSEEALCR